MSYREAFIGVGGLVVVDGTLGYYQGDWVALVLESDGYGVADRVGFLSYGYGSCSGCDEWQAAETLQERVQIVTRVVDAIKWFPTLAELKVWINGDHPDHEWYGNEDDWVDFLAKVNAIDNSLSFYALEAMAEENE